MSGTKSVRPESAAAASNTAGDESQWFLVDAEGMTLGRLSTVIATRLMGKHRPNYAPHRAFGDHVVVVNAEKVEVTGRKRSQKMYRWYTGYPGGLKEISLSKALAEHPARVIEWAVQGMLPKNKLASRMIRNLKAYAGPQHPHQAQRPEPLAIAPARKTA